MSIKIIKNGFKISKTKSKLINKTFRIYFIKHKTVLMFKAVLLAY